MTGTDGAREAVIAAARKVVGRFPSGDAGGGLLRAAAEAELRAAINALDALPAAGGEVREAAERVVEAARNMPRRTPAPGGNSTVHLFEIAAGTVWALDNALSRYDAILAALEAQPVAPQGDLAAILTGYENMGPEGDHPAAVAHLCQLLRTALQQEGDGTEWRWAPVEPTEEMLDAGVLDHRHEQSYAGARETYAAMLAAAPPPPIQDGWRFDMDNAPPSDHMNTFLAHWTSRGVCETYWDIDDDFDERPRGWVSPREGWRSPGDQCIPVNQADVVAWRSLPPPPSTEGTGPTSSKEGR